MTRIVPAFAPAEVNASTPTPNNALPGYLTVAVIVYVVPGMYWYPVDSGIFELRLIEPKPEVVKEL